MLFNSYIFIGAFLPTVLAGYALLSWSGQDRPSKVWLAAASLFFYGWWNVANVTVLLVSIMFNYLMGRALLDANRYRAATLRPLLVVGIGANLALLGFFKYSTFVVSNVGALAGIDFAIGAVALPLAISFFTFTQIAYLADAAAGKTGDYGFVNYFLFVTFFPHLIAGPIVHHREMVDQFRRPARESLQASAFAIGATFFSIGLFKKVIIADNLAGLADSAFKGVAEGAAPSAVAAWHGVMAYTLQIYFDFSGYSDMAIGLALMFGIRMPYNFNSPYQATSIIDFWRRWHMTLSRFLRDYLYVPLGGNQRGRARRFVNLMVTMVLGGLWHGAGWTFLIWGALHGVYLIVNQAWRWIRTRPGMNGSFGRAGVWTARFVTLIAVMIGWVFFRAPDVGTAFAMLRAMAGLHGWVSEGDALARVFLLPPGAGLAGTAKYWFGQIDTYIFVMVILGAVWLLPNSQEVVDGIGTRAGRLGLRWRPNLLWAAGVSACFLLTLTQTSKVSSFLYFQF